NSIGDDIEIYTDESRTQVRTTLHHLRQQRKKAPGQPNLCLADFVPQSLPPAPSLGGESPLPTSPKGGGENSYANPCAGEPARSSSEVSPLRGDGRGAVGAFAVAAGIGIEKWIEKFEREHDDYHAIVLKALADRLAEAFAERMHERVRKEFWGYVPEEKLTNEQLIREEYRGIRPAPGYPACPDHTEKATLWRLIDPERNAGIQLTDSFAM